MTNLTTLAKLTWVILTALLITSCGLGSGSTAPVYDPTGGSGSSTTGDDAELPDAAAATPLYFYLSTEYEVGTVTFPPKPSGNCYIDPANLAANDITCKITIPEGWLFFSKLNFKVGTLNPTLCPRIHFFPYYRRLSTSATYIPTNSTDEIDCSDAENASCYDGAARHIVPGFPINDNLWLPVESDPLFIEASVPSSRTQYGLGPRGNSLTCNNLAAGLRGAPVSVGGTQIYVANTFVDYEARCVDPHQGMLFRIVLTVEDEDTDASDTDVGNNQYYDW